MFEISAETAAEYRQKFFEEAKPHVHGEEVVAVAPFRRGGFGTQMAISKAGGGLAYAAHALFRKKQAGGLPDKVMLVVTPTKLYGFKWKFKGRNYRIQDEVAVWDRASLKASTERKANLTMLTIESPAEGEKATLAPGGVADDPWSQEVIAALQSGATTPATA
ncbi:MAG: hypothetical protein AABM29_08770 [Actinomycetota bacterium]